MFLINAGALIIGALILVIGVVAGIALAIGVCGESWFFVRGTRTTGEVVGVEQRRRPGGLVRVQVAYETPAGRFEMTDRLRRARLGEKVLVRYLPAKPRRAIALTGTWRLAVIGFPVALALVASGAGMVLGTAWYFSGSHARIQAPLTDGAVCLAVAVGFGYYSLRQYVTLFRWRRMVRTDGKILRYDERAPGGGRAGGILIAFQSADGAEEFWTRAGSAPGGIGDAVTVSYDPEKPAASATVDEARTVWAYALFSTILTLIMLAFTASSIITLS